MHIGHLTFSEFLEDLADEFRDREGPSWKALTSAVGLAVAGGVAVKLTYDFISGLNTHFGGAIGLKERLQSYGKWAVVTGCTRGIGREFAKQLAAHGLNIVLIARNEALVRELAEEIEEDHGVQTMRIRADFGVGEEVYPEIFDALASKEIGILGVMYEYPDYFHRVPEEKLWELLRVNIASAQSLTHCVLRHSMIPRKKGLVVTLSSGACFLPTPQMSAYAATKKYLGYLSLSLHGEMQHLGQSGIQIQSLTPMYIATDMTAYSKLIGTPSMLLSPHPREYVRHALWTFGRAAETTGYWAHSIQLFAASLMPSRAWIFMGNHLLAYFRRTALAAKNA